MDEPLSLLVPQFFYELPISSFPLPRTVDECYSTHELSKRLQNLETTTGYQLNSSANFLFLAVNQSTTASPCNHIVLNIGFNDEVAQNLALVTDPLFVYQCYRLFIETYSSVVFGVSPQDLSDIAEEIGLAESEKLDVTKLKMLINGYQNLLQFLNHVIPQDPREQLSLYVQKVSEKLPTDPIQLKVQCLLINDIHQPAITIDPSTKAFVTCEHGFDQNDTFLQSNHCTTSDGQKLDRNTKDLNAKAESIEDVVLFIKAEPELKKKFRGKLDTAIDAAATCLILVILAALLFLLLRSSTSKTFLISGTVTSDSVGLELADVLVSGDGFDDVYSNAEGYFELEPLVNAIYELTFELAGYDTKSVNVTVFDKDESIVVSLSLNTFVVSGTVTSDSVELADVLVSGDDFDDVYSNAEGYFELEPLVNAIYELTFELAGYDTKSVNVTVFDKDESIVVSLSLNTFVVSGTVTTDSVELADVLVYSDDFDDVYSNADGYFELEPLVNGIYELTFELAGYDTKSVNVTVYDNDESIDVSLSLNTFVVSGTVTTDSVELADVLVSGDGFDDVYSNADGYFELEPLVNGIYELTFELAGYDTKSVNVTVFDNDESIDVSLSLNTFVVSGTVTCDSVELADVLVSGDDFDDVYSNADGYFELEPLVNGIYELTFELAGYYTKFVNVTMSDSDRSIDVSLSLNTFVVSGTITTDSDELADVLVSGDDFDDVYSNADGYFELEPLVNGIYELTFELAGYDTKSVNVTVSDNDESIDVSLSLNTFVVSGTITTDSDELADVLVSGDDFDDVYSNADGYFELEPLVNGIYELTFELAGYDTKSVNVTVSDNDESIDVSLSLTLYSLEYFIYDDFTSEPISNSRVQLNQDLIVDGNEEGYVLLADLIPGDYELTLMHSDYYDRTLTVQLDSSKTESFSLIQHGLTMVNNTISEYEQNLIIPSSINGVEIKAIGDLAFQHRRLSSVVIPDTVLTIGQHAFDSNKELVSVSFGNGLTTIGHWAFDQNAIEELVIPDSLITIGMLAFHENSLTTVTFGSSLEVITGGAFMKNSIESLKFPNSLQSLGMNDFAENPVLRVEIGAGVSMEDSSIPGGFNSVYGQHGAGVYSRSSTSDSWSYEG
ncbi:hypothetical protein GEMRC1_007490 [Eukaryota sp. GEM-RC1]